ncbi:MAG: DUF1211 domain-containing protein [Furfurilactobacillus sp.]|jgi:uncharacterized membrane protein|uniref:TMEM175 family protein n=1 Tax=Furfurilactobacillus sp. TaxID=2767911 RepID=UPI0025851D9C|nr:TMEM175 family protein [Furfurilactobacillus sp.]MCH4011814.1 DUF1211 domain-containing protein [Furfurilactobacillus sp.]MCH4037706.1 DUF1211 domain-containing protein [Furfurilactobacillus sp.]MCH4115658.1 DUF1211 domain-containing protein [Furfurilactobacillus sp.]MCI1339728.1 DUF1211 domain-containing protein [Furfurilactobacillus sp.]MCI1386815.1 DUF1211 domain-containing protein [Furfurilactobacillus sp.]
MSKSRIEAFTDGVVAIIITILVLDLKLPEQHTWAALWQMRMPFVVYVASFLMIAEILNFHHQMFAAVEKTDAHVLWANMNLLFWMSLIPAVTAWYGTDIFARPSAVLYALIVLPFNISFIILNHAVQHANQLSTKEGISADSERRNQWSLIINVLVIIITFFFPPFALLSMILNVIIWLIPLRRVRR